MNYTLGCNKIKQPVQDKDNLTLLAQGRREDQLCSIHQMAGAHTPVAYTTHACHVLSTIQHQYKSQTPAAVLVVFHTHLSRTRISRTTVAATVQQLEQQEHLMIQQNNTGNSPPAARSLGTRRRSREQVQANHKKQSASRRQATKYSRQQFRDQILQYLFLSFAQSYQVNQGNNINQSNLTTFQLGLHLGGWRGAMPSSSQRIL